MTSSECFVVRPDGYALFGYDIMPGERICQKGRILSPSELERLLFPIPNKFVPADHVVIMGSGMAAYLLYQDFFTQDILGKAVEKKTDKGNAYVVFPSVELYRGNVSDVYIYDFQAPAAIIPSSSFGGLLDNLMLSR